MVRISGAIISLALLATASDAREVFRCQIERTPGETVTVLSDRPCARDAETVEVRPATPPGHQIAAASARLAGLEEEQRLRKAAKQGEVLVGMTADQVRQAWGRPDRKNLTDYADGQRDQWVYYRHNRTDYVHFNDGLVSSVSASVDVERQPRAILMGQ
jgi:hypothetical protein